MTQNENWLGDRIVYAKTHFQRFQKPLALFINLRYNMCYCEVNQKGFRVKNKKIGNIGEDFIKERLNLGIEFDVAWDEWALIERKLRFVLIDCPEVDLYDDRRVSDSDERKRIRMIAKKNIDPDLLSPDVSLLAMLAISLDIKKPIKKYEMDRSVVVAWIEKFAENHELLKGFDEFMGEIKQLLASDSRLNALTLQIEEFAERHSLWAVPPEYMMDMFFNHNRSTSDRDE